MQIYPTQSIYKPRHSAFSYCKEEHDKENLILSINYDVAAKKRKKDLLNNNTKIPCEYRHCFLCEIRTAVTAKILTYFFIADFHKDKWIYVHKGSTKEVRPVISCSMTEWE